MSIKSSQFLLILLLAFVGIGAGVHAGLMIGRYKNEIPTNVYGYTEPIAYIKIIPVKKTTALEPVLSAQSAYIVDVDSKDILLNINAQVKHLPASTAKILTALVALDYYNQDSVLTVPQLSVEGAKMKLVVGDRLRVLDIVKGLLIASGNDAAEVLAYYYPGGRDGFVNAMNLKAEEIGLVYSNFTHPAGLDSPDQYTTAQDLAKAATYALDDDIFSQIVRTKNEKIISLNNNLYNLENINELLGAVEGVYGVKTGWTQDAKENLVTYLEREGRRFIIVVMSSDDRFGETKYLIEWLNESYEWVQKEFDYGSTASFEDS